MLLRHALLIHLHQHVAAIGQRTQAIELAGVANRAGHGVAAAHQDGRVQRVHARERACAGAGTRPEVTVPDAVATLQGIDLGLGSGDGLAIQL